MKKIEFTVDNSKFDIDKLKEIAAHNPNFKLIDLRDCAGDAEKGLVVGALQTSNPATRNGQHPRS